MRIAIDVGTTLGSMSVDGTDRVIVDGELVAGPGARGASRDLMRRFGQGATLDLGGTLHTSESLLVAMLRTVVASSGGRTRGVDAVLVHPASWNRDQLALLRAAGEQAGLTAIELMSAPVAAIRSYVSVGQLADGDVVGVYDFGAGTFTASVVSVAGDRGRVIGGPVVLDHFGGIDIDQLLVDHVAASGALGPLGSRDRRTQRVLDDLRLQCRAAKELLSVETEVTIHGDTRDVPVTRTEFELMLRPRLVATVDALDRSVRDARLGPGDLAGVVLTGGSAQIPVIGRMIAESIGRPVLASVRPDLATVLGALAVGGADVARSGAIDDIAASVVGNPTNFPIQTSTFVLPPPPAGPLEAAPALASVVATGVVAGAFLLDDRSSSDHDSLDAFDSLVAPSAEARHGLAGAGELPADAGIAAQHLFVAEHAPERGFEHTPVHLVPQDLGQHDNRPAEVAPAFEVVHGVDHFDADDFDDARVDHGHHLSPDLAGDDVHHLHQHETGHQHDFGQFDFDGGGRHDHGAPEHDANGEDLDDDFDLGDD